jgi:predicted component of type VI protein secretion system
LYTLIVETGKNKGRRIDLPNRPIVIGRSESCFIRMTAEEVSRDHCTLIPADHGLLLRDLGSGNGTYVNAVRVTGEMLVRPGDVLRIGPTTFRLDSDAPTPDAESIEDDAFGWLSEGDTAVQMTKDDDTRIIKIEQPETSLPEPKPTFKSIAEEAREIIRRHRESLGESPGEFSGES